MSGTSSTPDALGRIARVNDTGTVRQTMRECGREIGSHRGKAERHREKYRPIMVCLRPARELEDLADNLEPRWHLPEEQRHVGNIQRNVAHTCRLVPFLHRRHKRGRERPQQGYAETCVQMRAGEELADANVCVQAALDREEYARSEQ